jgi:hypothetical protein
MKTSAALSDHDHPADFSARITSSGLFAALVRLECDRRPGG